MQLLAGRGIAVVQASRHIMICQLHLRLPLLLLMRLLQYCDYCGYCDCCNCCDYCDYCDYNGCCYHYMCACHGRYCCQINYRGSTGLGARFAALGNGNGEPT